MKLALLTLVTLNGVLLSGCGGPAEDPKVQEARDSLPPNFKLSMGDSEGDKPVQNIPEPVSAAPASK